ncbi:MAG: hypothetical protein GY940_44635 [bacterium]|nr:hypothetical protein [bacterium]
MCKSTQHINEYYEILELGPGASFSEIKSSYIHLKKLYSSQSVVLASIVDDFSDGRQEALLEKIEEAYRQLKEHFSKMETEKQAVTRDRVNHQNIPEFEVYSGNALRLTREVLNVELKEIALATGIPLSHLKNIEMERLELLPPLGYVRIYVSKYAEYLSLDVQRVIDDYMRITEKKKGK